MPRTPVTGDPAARTIEEQFFDVVCGDADLLAAEFDAIIAAEWPEPPVDTPARGAAGGHPASSAVGHAAEPVRSHVLRPRRPGIGEWRQRSPPFVTNAPQSRKAGDRPT
jgi:hypothetical protein